MTFKELIDMIRLQSGNKDIPNSAIFAQMNLALPWLRAQLLTFAPESLRTETDIDLDGTTTPISSQNLCSPTNYYVGDIEKVIWSDSNGDVTLERYAEIVGKSLTGTEPRYYYHLGCTLYFAPSIQTSGTLKIVHYQKLKPFVEAYGAANAEAILSNDFDLTVLLDSGTTNPYLEQNITGFTNAFIYKVALDLANNGDYAQALVNKLQNEQMTLMQNRPKMGRFKSPYEKVFREVK